MIRGRYLNEFDLRQFRKSAVLGTLVEAALFHDEEPIGKEIRIGGISFKVVGVFDDEGSEREREFIYLPISTAQRTFNGANRVNQILYTTGDASLAKSMEMARRDAPRSSPSTTTFDPEDQRAIYVNNNVENYQKIVALIGGDPSLRLGGRHRHPARRRGRGVEHHAGRGARAHPRDRHPQGARRHAGLDRRPGAAGVGAITTVAGYAGLVLGVSCSRASRASIPDAAFFRNPRSTSASPSRPPSC